jgi:GNAT superfamily N-acetyltransferase
VHRIDWRRPTRDDDEAWAGLLAAIERADDRGETYALEDLADEWASMWAHPATDAWFGWDGPELVAFGWAKVQPRTVDQHVIELWGGVAPSHRGRGIGRQLLGRQLDRAREVAAGFDPALPTDVRIDAGQRQADLLALATRLGFAPVRTFLELARPLAEAPPPAPGPAGIELHPWDDRFDDGTRAAHGEAFAGTWEGEPRTDEVWRQWYTGHRAFRPDLSWVAVAGAEVVSYALCAAYPQDWLAGPREVWINDVGTRPAWRGRGAATATLGAVLRSAAEAADGFERAILGVDRDNATGAVGLYRSLGFGDVRAVVTLARRL